MSEKRLDTERVQRAARRMTSALIAVAPLLQKPYTDAPDLSPWSRFVEPALQQVRWAAGLTRDGDES